MKQFFITLLIVLMLVPHAALSSTTTDTFDPNFIISDEELGYWQSMAQTDIQRFLDSQGGYIARLRTEDVDGNVKLASEIIYDAAKKYQINPKYIIVKLQKEQSLVTHKTPSKKRLDWATGYGICDSCAKDDPRLQKFRGFGNQVDYAAGIMRWYYDNVTEQSFIKRPGTTYAISGKSVSPANLATAFLYTYTPHIEGNKNFWTLWNTWFQSRYPNGTLIQGDDSAEIYLLSDGKKRKFKNYTALITRFDPELVVKTPEAELSDYPDGPDIALPNYAVLKQGSKYYLLDYDTLRPFASNNVVKELGYNPDEIIDVKKSDIAGYTLGKTITVSNANPLGELIYVEAINTNFYIKEGVYHAILDPKIIDINYPHLEVRSELPEYIEQFEQGTPTQIKDGVIFGVETFNKIYVMENGYKRHIANPEVFEGLGYDWDNIKWVSVYTGPTIPTGEPLTSAPNRKDTANEQAATFDASNVDVVDGEQITAVTTPATQTIDVKDESVDTNAKEFDPVELMVRTPEDEREFIGTQFDTEVETYLVYDVTKKEIVAGKNIDYVRQPASLQKVLTAIMLTESRLDLTDTTVYDPALHKGLYHRYRIAPGEEIRHANLMDAFLVSSLNTPGRMLVEGTTGDEDKFISDLNILAQQLWGLKATKAFDVTGELVANETTARDFLTIFKRAIQDDDVNKYMKKRSYEYTAVVDKDGKPNHYDTHTNDLIELGGKPYTIHASKTGFLWESGGNLAMHVTRNSDGKEFIIITMGDPNFGDLDTAPDLITRWALETF